MLLLVFKLSRHNDNNFVLNFIYKVKFSSEMYLIFLLSAEMFPELASNRIARNIDQVRVKKKSKYSYASQNTNACPPVCDSNSPITRN